MQQKATLIPSHLRVRTKSPSYAAQQWDANFQKQPQGKIFRRNSRPNIDTGTPFEKERKEAKHVHLKVYIPGAPKSTPFLKKKKKKASDP